MNASYTSLELEGITRDPFEANSETIKGASSQSIQFGIEDSLPKSVKKSSYHRLEPNGETPLRSAFRPRRRRKKWRSIANHCNACCFVSGAIVALVMLPLLGLGVPSNYISTEFPSFGICEPNGNFNTGLDPISVWSPSKAFQITLAFGSFSFSTAKFIDIIWDVAIGRGLQVILGIIMYRAFTKSLARHMERSLVSIGTFESVALQGASVQALVTLIRDYFTNSGVRAKLTVTWMILALSYVLVFPTLMSAMTGYSATTQPYIQTVDGSEVEWSFFRQVNYIIYDGWRVGLTEGYLVTGVSQYPSIDPSNYLEANICSNYWITEDGTAEVLGDPEALGKCVLTIAVSEYVGIYDFHGLNHTSSTFSPDNSTFFNLTSPTLNISAFYIYPACSLSGSGIFSEYYSPLREVFSNVSLARFARIDHPDNLTYDIPYIRDQGRCQQQSTYQWGFSFLLLFIALLLSTLWALGMWVMWLDAYYNSKIDAVWERDMGSWRAVMDLAEGIAGSLNSDVVCDHDAIGDVNDGTKSLGDSEIRRRVGQEPGRKMIGYVGMFGPDKAVITRAVRLRRWLERRKWGRWLLRWRGWVIAGATMFVISLPLGIILSYDDI